MPSEHYRSFRIVCHEKYVPLVEALLSLQGFAFAPEPFSPLARRLVKEPFPLGGSIAAAFGYIYIQDRSSMLPPVALAPRKGEAVLDMCASPGSKTGMLGQMVGPGGFVLGNEPSRNRLATLRRNLQSLNLPSCCTCSYPGEALPLAEASWERIQLDPPCSGWGTAEKNPLVLKLWQGEKVKPLIELQRRLLTRAVRLLRPGGRLVYSTCTTNVEENEEQLRFACEELGLTFVPLPDPEGFSLERSALPGFEGAWRVEGGADGQGFFVGLLQKGEAVAGRCEQGAAQEPEYGWAADERGDGCGGLRSYAAPAGIGPDAPDGSFGPSGQARQDLRGGVFVRPWEKESRYVGERRRFGKEKRAGKGAGARARDKGWSDVGEALSFEALAGGFADPSLLPPGTLSVFNGQAYFLPEASASLVPQNVLWKGFPVGRLDKAGNVRVAPRLRFLMPEAEAARNLGFTVLDLDDPEPVLALLAGRSLDIEGPSCAGAGAAKNAGSEAGLYFRGLPLCRLAVKGSRAVLPQ